LNEIAIKGYKVSVDLKKGGSGMINIHALVNGKKYFYSKTAAVFLDSALKCQNMNTLQKGMQKAW